MTEKSGVGVIVARFQVPVLHPGHIELVNTVLARHDRVIIFLGSTPGVLNSKRNPLDFASRSAAVREAFPNHHLLYVLPLQDNPSDSAWSHALDKAIQSVVGEDYPWVTLYGSRDSFIPHYSGAYPTVELAQSVEYVTGSTVRDMIHARPQESARFREGIVYAAYQRRATPFMAVDIAATYNGLVVLGRKKTDPKGLWRFPGGFLSPDEDKSLEDCVLRELGEEIPFSSPVASPRYILSRKIDDWRYRKERDKIFSALFEVPLKTLDGLEAGDDLDDGIRVFPISEETTKFICAKHVPLFTALLEHNQ